MWLELSGKLVNMDNVMYVRDRYNIDQNNYSLAFLVFSDDFQIGVQETKEQILKMIREYE